MTTATYTWRVIATDRHGEDSVILDSLSEREANELVDALTGNIAYSYRAEDSKH